MIVTKTVRSYIEREVRAIVEKREYQELSERMRKRVQQIEAIIDAEVDELINMRLPQLVAEYGIPADYNLRRRNGQLGRRLLNDDESMSKIWQDARAEAAENHKATQTAVEEIVLTLELGGSKADLDRMISELKLSNK